MFIVTLSYPNKISVIILFINTWLFVNAIYLTFYLQYRDIDNRISNDSLATVLLAPNYKYEKGLRENCLLSSSI